MRTLIFFLLILYFVFLACYFLYLTEAISLISSLIFKDIIPFFIERNEILAEIIKEWNLK